MDEDITRRMKEVEQHVLNLDPSVRGEAFAMMRGYILAGQVDANEAAITEGDETTTRPTGTPSSLEQFLKTHESEKEHGNVLAAAAFWYEQYGTTAFSTSDIRSMADRAGVTVPMRIDKTLGSTKQDGKPLFRRSGRRFSPTPHGERYLKNTYGVSKGTATPSEHGEDEHA